jgi:hypothetical protein
MIRLIRRQKEDIRVKTQLEPNDKALMITRLTEKFFEFPVGSLCVINTRKKWFYIFDGTRSMSGPVNKDIKWRT